jgi:hypothetical protein
MTPTSIFFKVSFFAGLLASLCAVVAQGAVTLLVLPSSTNQVLTIPQVSVNFSIGVPWSADQTLAPSNDGMIVLGQLGTRWTYLEQIVGSSVADVLPQGYLVPLITRTNNTAGNQYPTDVVHIQCECSWVAPTLPSATNQTIIPVSLDSFGITAIQYGPTGIARRCLRTSMACESHVPPTEFSPLSNMTFSSNSTPVTSGLFAWTLWYDSLWPFWIL